MARKTKTTVPAKAASAPQFSQPIYTPDPTKFIVDHASDNAAYEIIDKLTKEHKIKPLPFPASRGGVEPVLTLAQTLGSGGQASEAAITASGQIVFHSVGDTGNTKNVGPQDAVTDKMVADFDDPQARDTPQFFFHLGDVVYSFGESQYYYDQFYEPYRNYPAPVVAIAGNHDGMPAPNSGTASLEAFLANFCADPAQGFVVTPEAGGLNRTAQIQPGVYYTFEAPFVRILALYSNALEDPGVISSDELGTAQLDYLHAALSRVKTEAYEGALIIAHHHPAYTSGKHGWSIEMTKAIDAICADVGVWPHAVLSAHAHNYQRFTRRNEGRETPYLVAGGGGHNVTHLTKKGSATLRTPMIIQQGDDQVTLENYDDQDYGYLRIVVNAQQLRIEYHPAGDGADAKTPDDSVTVDLATRTLATYQAAPGVAKSSVSGEMSDLGAGRAGPAAPAGHGKGRGKKASTGARGRKHKG